MLRIFPPIKEEPAKIGLPILAPTKVDILAIVFKTFLIDFGSGLSASGFASLYKAKFIVSLYIAAPCHNKDRSEIISCSSISKSCATSFDNLFMLKSA